MQNQEFFKNPKTYEKNIVLEKNFILDNWKKPSKLKKIDHFTKIY